MGCNATVKRRLARLLLEQAADGVLLRHRWTTRTEMAALIGAVPDVLNRAMRPLVEEGLIQIERHQIRIVDRQRLEGQITLD